MLHNSLRRRCQAFGSCRPPHTYLPIYLHTPPQYLPIGITFLCGCSRGVVSRCAGHCIMLLTQTIFRKRGSAAPPLSISSRPQPSFDSEEQPPKSLTANYLYKSQGGQKERGHTWSANGWFTDRSATSFGQQCLNIAKASNHGQYLLPPTSTTHKKCLHGALGHRDCFV